MIISQLFIRVISSIHAFHMKNENDLIPFTGKYQDANRRNGINGKVSFDDQNAVTSFSGNNYQPLFDYCLIDHTGRQFACVHDLHCQEKSRCFKSGLLHENIDFHKLHFHPEDRIIWCEEAFPDILKFLESEPVLQFPDYRFIFNHRYIRKDGSISQFMHEGSISFMEDRLFPVLNLKVFFEIADIRTNETMVLTIFRYSPELGYQKIFSREYGGISNSLLTLREMEIIRLCHEGMSSKMIAEKLNLSIHTVKNHKRHCMEKTLTHNITELIHLCITNNWL